MNVVLINCGRPLVVLLDLFFLPTLRSTLPAAIQQQRGYAWLRLPDEPAGYDDGRAAVATAERRWQQ
uniref:Putative secreted protein n=1 Tax=Anopheles triannulatus TaxID=58253 RepID=A0A2M4B1D0_9DIPT